jgi:hypothetical protein
MRASPGNHRRAPGLWLGYGSAKGDHPYAFEDGRGVPRPQLPALDLFRPPLSRSSPGERVYVKSVSRVRIPPCPRIISSLLDSLITPTRSLCFGDRVGVMALVLAAR